MTVRPARAADERGSVAPLAVAVIGVLLLLGMSANLVVAVAAAHRTAQAAADLAALAGARAWQEQHVVALACAEASSVAGDNDARLVDCRIEGDDVLAVVEVASPEMFGREFDIHGRARAGPEQPGQ